MSDIFEFSQTTKEELKYYVYCLIDPRNGELFYIGKGCGARVFNHEKEVAEKNKNLKIREIEQAGYAVKKYIIRHGIEEGEALHIEAALIDLLSSGVWNNKNLLNLVKGHHTLDNGMKSIAEIEAYYAVEEIKENDFQHNALIININRTYQTVGDLYQATRKSWVLSENKLANIEIVISEYKGVFRAIFQPKEWFKDKNHKQKKRWMFEGDNVSDSEKYSLYLNKRNGFKEQGMANPVRYVLKGSENPFTVKVNDKYKDPDA